MRLTRPWMRRTPCGSRESCANWPRGLSSSSSRTASRRWKWRTRFTGSRWKSPASLPCSPSGSTSSSRRHTNRRAPTGCWTHTPSFSTCQPAWTGIRLRGQPPYDSHGGFPMGLPHCPRCKKNLVQQSPRHGVLEAIVRVFGIYPFRCQLCTHRFLAFEWWLRRLSSYYGRREYVRIPVWFQLAFSGKQVSGEGTVVNLSRQGCTIETGTLIPSGEPLCLRIYEPDGPPP